MSSQKPLDASKRQIRVLRLASRMSTLSIKCHLTTVDLQDKPEYEALSYVWGSTTDDLREISVDGVAHVVTKTLYDALKALRHRNKTRILWVDALCIDQKNYDERSHQVGMMGSIYAAANRVLVWLNKSVPGNYRVDLAGTRAIKKLKKPGRLDEKYQVRMTKFLYGRDQWWYRAWTFQEAVLGPQLVFHAGRETFTDCDLSEILENLKLAYPNLDNLDNPEQDDVEKAVPKARIIGPQMLQLLKTRMSLQEHAKRHLLDLVSANRDRAATDPRDLFYAYVGLAHDVPVDFIRYDLTDKAWIVYTTMKLIQHNQTLDILRHVHAGIYERGPLEYHRGRKSFSEDLPSWCPDWIQASGPDPIRNHTWKQFFSSGQRKTKQLSFQPPDLPESMHVSGIFCDKITQVGDMSVSYHTLDRCWWYLVLGNRSLHLAKCSLCKYGIYGTRHSCTVCHDYNLCSGCYHMADCEHADHEFLAIPKRPSELIHSTADGPGGEPSILDIFKAMRLGKDSKDGSTNRARLWEKLDAYHYPYPRRKSLQEVFQQVITGNLWPCGSPEEFDHFRDNWIRDSIDNDPGELESKTLNPMFDRTFGKRPVISDKGYIGWGPDDTKVGDIVTVLHGAGMPLILRRLDKSKMEAGVEVTKYTLVGEAYISGLMDGEALDSVKEGTLHEQIFSIY